MIGVHTKNKEYIDNFLGELRRRKVSDIRVTTIKNRLKHTLDTTDTTDTTDTIAMHLRNISPKLILYT